MLQSGEARAGMEHQGSGKMYMATKVDKLNTENVNGLVTGGVSNIFDGCGLLVNGYAGGMQADGSVYPTLQALKQLIIEHGGTFNAYTGTATTHEVSDHWAAAIAESKQLKSAKRAPSGRRKYVTMAWVLQSVARGIRLKEEDFVPACLQTFDASKPITDHFPVPVSVPASTTSTSTSTSTSSSTRNRGPALSTPQYHAQSRLHWIGTLSRNYITTLSTCTFVHLARRHMSVLSAVGA